MNIIYRNGFINIILNILLNYITWLCCIKNIGSLCIHTYYLQIIILEFFTFKIWLFLFIKISDNFKISFNSKYDILRKISLLLSDPTKTKFRVLNDLKAFFRKIRFCGFTKLNLLWTSTDIFNYSAKAGIAKYLSSMMFYLTALLQYFSSLFNSTFRI